MKPFKFATRMGLALCVSFNLVALSAQAQVAHTPKHPAQRSHTTGTKKPPKPDTRPVMTLRFHNVHTNENLTLTRHAGEALPQNAAWFMRDYREGEVKAMDPKLFDLLDKLQTEIKKKHPTLSVTFDVVSSYRTPETNENLRDAGGSQAKYSQHMLGKAMDIRVPGVSTVELRNIATCLKGGGVGYYAEDQFVHVDVGRVRYWPSHDYLSSLPCKNPKAPVLASNKQIRPNRG
jgi:uncharacterized protein YcbK (DUF882 family)